MRWPWRWFRDAPREHERSDERAAAEAEWAAKAKLAATERHLARHVKPELDRFARAIEQAMRGTR